MATGRSNQLIKQIGEYLVACELARRGLLVATFSGNVPDFDLIATDFKGSSCPAEKYGEDQFFVLEWSKVQDIAIANYTNWLDSHGGVRPRNPDSLHCSIIQSDLQPYKDNWSIINKRL